MELVLVRHAETFGNTGADDSADPALTLRGRLQAEQLAKALCGTPFDAVFSSPLRRAVQTAAMIVGIRPQPLAVELTPLLAEHEPIPGYSGLPDAALRAICPSAVYPDRFALPPEDDAQALARAERFLLMLHTRFADENARVLCVAHGQFNTYLLLAAAGLPLGRAKFSQGNACINRLSTRSDSTKFHYVNRLEHLPQQLRT